MDKLILLFCSFISCVIIINLLFQFLNDRFSRVYQSKLLYAVVKMVSVLVIMTVNMFMNHIFNLMINILLFGLISCFFYYESQGKLIRVFEAEAFLAVSIILEAMGVFLINFLMNIIGVAPNNIITKISIGTIFSKIVLLILYFALFSCLWKKEVVRTKTQYKIYGVIFIYSISSFLVISALSNNGNSIILMVIVSGTIFTDIYLLYFIKYSEERNYYKLQYEMMLQQEILQYNSYEMQKEKYIEAVTILHDVDKHIKIIESLCHEGMKRDVIHYAKQINEILLPLAPKPYTDNVVLNCLLTDKIKTIGRLDIMMKINIGDVDIEYMKPVDITNIFGNLLDNAINASSKCLCNKYIGFFI